MKGVTRKEMKKISNEWPFKRLCYGYSYHSFEIHFFYHSFDTNPWCHMWPSLRYVEFYALVFGQLESSQIVIM